MKVVRLSDEHTEVQAAVIQLHAGQRKSWLKFGAIMILLLMTTGLVLRITAGAADWAADRIERAVRGTQEP